jgi:hypothetical protein
MDPNKHTPIDFQGFDIKMHMLADAWILHAISCFIMPHMAMQ